MGLISRLPWWMKLGAKIALARLPIPYSIWRLLNLFRHGDMNLPDWALNTFDKFYRLAGGRTVLSPGFCSLELGPGDSILSGLVARAYGAKKAWLVDAGKFSCTSYFSWLEMTRILRDRGLSLPEMNECIKIDELMRISDVQYLTNGTLSLAEISDSTIDFFWSQVVLEHISKAEFPFLLKELRRVDPPHGIGVHSIDFRDHLGGGLNNLRFRDSIWESWFFRKSGFYTNRIRPQEMVALFAEAGFVVEIIGLRRWAEMPLRRDQLASQFRLMSEDDLTICEMEIVVRPS
jgi:hypothetical protein